MQRAELNAYLDQYLDVARFRDYCPNGLQVEGKADVARIVTGVTASLELIERAIEARADAILVHHGYFWRNEDPRVVGIKRRRLATLLEHDLNLYAFHLPLDAHREVGNNVTLGVRLGLTVEGRTGEQDLVFFGRADGDLTLSALARRVEASLARPPLVVGDPDRRVRRIAWCTGAAQGYLEDAVRIGADAYITGEASEQTVHLARESGVGFIGAGHHATERYGIEALGRHLAHHFGLAHVHVDVPNPV
ncbi:MAG TPA: Nif3-like dinuclear metal center hexameric protein [Burkholderiales bacterium]|nr:Nif3-like dinuclear metal center hexameric protein [Burkholderiales bacterium]